MAEQKVLYLEEKQGDWGVHTRAIPTPGPGQLLVRVEAAGLNPVDWKIAKYGFALTEFPAILGSDGSGVVEALGEGVEGYAKGDRVLFPGAFIKYDENTYQQYALTTANLTAKVPSALSLEEAASIPTGLATAGVGYYALKSAARGGAELTPPWIEGGQGKYAGKPIFILGGSSIVGIFALQFAKLSGFSPIITTASAHNEALVRSFGATHFVPRTDPLADADAARAIVGAQPIDLVFDTVSLPETQQAAWGLLAPGGTLVVTLDPVVTPGEGETRRAVHPVAVLGFPDQHEVGQKLYANLARWLEEGVIIPGKVEVLPGGLAAIPAGLKLLEDNKVSGKKLVVKPQETV